MPAYNLKRFSNPNSLKAVSIDCLLQFLSPYSDFLAERGLSLDEHQHGRDDFDYVTLVDILMSPDNNTPRQLVDALYYINELSTTQGMDLLLTEAESRRVEIELKNPTPIDVAMRMWIREKEIVEYAHARESMARSRTFVYFRTDMKQSMAREELKMDAVQSLQGDLDDWFVRRQRGRGSRVFVFDKESEVWFLVRHGEAFKREGVLDDGRSSSVFYRPEQYDVLVYNPRLGDLRIHATSKNEVEMYRELFGRHIFGDDRYFPSTAKYTLEPVRKNGDASLVCADISGIESITLVELEFGSIGFHENTVQWRAADIFDWMRSTGQTIPSRARLFKAVFNVMFSGAKRPRKVCIQLPNIAQFQRDGDGRLVEQWLELRGFIIGFEQETNGYEESQLLVAV